MNRKVYRVILRVALDVDLDALSAHEILSIASDYQPTDESPEPDDEWLAEEWAMFCARKGGDDANGIGIEEIEVSESHLNRNY